MPANQRNIVANSLDSIILGATSADLILSQSLQQVKLMKKSFHQWMTESRTEVSQEWKKIVGKGGRNPTFEEYWKAGAQDFAEGLVPPSYVVACRARGIGGLLEARTVRLTVGALMSLIFSQIVGNGRHSRITQIGDSYDLWHATLASVADLFLTRDPRFAETLARIPIDNFRVCQSIPELLRYAI